jgi:hypothetical protein
LWSSLQYSLRGQVRLFFGGRFNALKGVVNPLVLILLVCLAATIVLLIVYSVRNLRTTTIRARELRLETRQKTVLLLSLLWAFIYLAFLFIWLPQNTFYRPFYLPALILLLGLAVASIRTKVSHPRRIANLFVAAIALANFLFLIYPSSRVEKYPPLAFALQLNRDWAAGTVIYYGAENSDEGLVRYFTPATEWKVLRTNSLASLENELANIGRRGGTAWLETTAIDNLNSTTEGARWLDTHAIKESSKELNDSAYKIRFVQVRPGER